MSAKEMQTEYGSQTVASTSAFDSGFRELSLAEIECVGGGWSDGEGNMFSNESPSSEGCTPTSTNQAGFSPQTCANAGSFAEATAFAACVRAGASPIACQPVAQEAGRVAQSLCLGIPTGPGIPDANPPQYDGGYGIHAYWDKNDR